MSKKEDSILLSPKHGVNPSVTRCICCGKDYGVALLGKLKNDEEAPREIFHGLCNECKSVIESGGVMIIEVKDGEENKKTPYRTGRLVGCSKDFRERNNIKSPIVYMVESDFKEIFKDVEFKKEEDVHSD